MPDFVLYYVQYDAFPIFKCFYLEIAELTPENGQKRDEEQNSQKTDPAGARKSKNKEEESKKLKDQFLPVTMCSAAATMPSTESPTLFSISVLMP